MGDEMPDVIGAYIELLEEMPFSRILVKELVAKSGIPRSTFYLNYGGTLEVLEQIEQHLLEERPFTQMRAKVLTCRSIACAHGSKRASRITEPSMP